MTLYYSISSLIRSFDENSISLENRIRERQLYKLSNIQLYDFHFSAPEVINFDPISVQSDMWSLGVITYVLLSGISPFLGDDDGETLQNVTFGEFDFEDEDGAFEHVSEEAKEFISDLLCLNPRYV